MEPTKLPDPRGPIVRKGIAPRVTAEGVEAKGYKGEKLGRVGKPQKGKWIWLASKAPVVLVRRELTLNTVPKAAPAFLSADNAYRLWVNGTLVARGPADIGMDYHRVPTGKWFYDTVSSLRPI